MFLFTGGEAMKVTKLVSSKYPPPHSSLFFLAMYEKKGLLIQLFPKGEGGGGKKLDYLTHKFRFSVISYLMQVGKAFWRLLGNWYTNLLVHN